MFMRGFTLLFAIIGIAFAVAGSTLAQGSADTVKSLPGIEITTSVDNATVYVGDLITYSISITRDSIYQLVPPPLGANLGSFDVKDYQPDIESKLPGGRLKSETIFKLSTFTTGDYVIPPVPIQFMLKDGSRRILLADAVPITVQSLLQSTDDSADIHPLKAQHEFQRNYLKYYIWGGLIFVLLVGYLLIWWWLRRRKKLINATDRRSPWEIAFEKLARLEQKGFPGQGKFKEFYFELTEIAREYLGKAYSAEVLEMTTEEFLDYFRGVELPAGLFDSCSVMLKHADLVKFAKHVPEVERCTADFQYIHSIIGDVRADIERKQAALVAAAHTPPAPTPTSGGTRG